MNTQHQVLTDEPTLTSKVVNDACWKFVEAMPHPLPGPIWNDLKPALYAALIQYHRATLAAATQVQPEVQADCNTCHLILADVRSLTAHIADVLSDDEFEKLDTSLWNNVTRHVGAAQMRSAALATGKREPLPDGFQLVAVKGFDDLVYWLDRCDHKGHLEQCSDLIEPWAAFEFRRLDGITEESQ